jgi:transcription antitermination protein NusB
MGARRKARELALQALYQIDIARTTAEDALAKVLEKGSSGGEVQLFAEQLVHGTAEKREKIDRALEAVSENWSLYRMAILDRNILRLAAYEILFCDEIPAAVSINEAVEIAKRYGDDNSPAFINGILDRIAKGAAKL